MSDFAQQSYGSADLSVRYIQKGEHYGFGSHGWFITILREDLRTRWVIILSPREILRAHVVNRKGSCTRDDVFRDIMVLLHVKVCFARLASGCAPRCQANCQLQKTDDQQFLYEIPVATGVEEATQQLIKVQNLRSRVHRCAHRASLQLAWQATL